MRAVHRAVDPLVEAISSPPRHNPVDERLGVPALSVARSAQPGRFGLSAAEFERRELSHVDPVTNIPRRGGLDEPLLCEPAERLTHGRPADSSL